MWYGVAVLVAGLIATPVAIVVLRQLRVVDIPNHRSSHQHVTVRSAGIGVALVGVTALLVASRQEQSSYSLVATAAACFALTGMLGDREKLSVFGRLLIQVVIALVTVVFLDLNQVFGGLSLAVAPVAVVGIVGYVNAFNFMDGVNGISSLHAGSVGATWLIGGLLSDLSAATLLGAVIVACALAFLPYNFPHARGFLGDVGSYYFGGLIAVSALMLLGDLPTLLIVLPLLTYAVDTGSTLLRRIRSGKVWHEAHREHVYQRLLGIGWNHTHSATLVGGLTLFGGATALMAAHGTRNSVVASLILVPFLVTNAAYLALPEFLEHQSRRRLDAP